MTLETSPLEITDDDVRNYLMDKQISKERRSYDPNYSRIIAIGVKSANDKTIVLSGEDEKNLLRELWRMVSTSQVDVFVTHNGYSGEIPFLVIRSVVNKIPVPVQINTSKWNMETSNHFDTMQFFSQYGTFTNPNLEILAKLHGLDVQKAERHSGADVEKLYRNKEWEKIRRHCGENTELLEKVFVSFCLPLVERRNTKSIRGY